MKINKIEQLGDRTVLIKVKCGLRLRNVLVIRVKDKWLLKCTKRDVTDMVDEALALLCKS